MSTKGEAAVTISRSTTGKVVIELTDKASRAMFARVHMTPHDFAMALTGLGYVDALAEYRGLHLVGKVRQVQSVTLDTGITGFAGCETATARRWLEAQTFDGGWVPDTALASQGSVTREPSGAIQINTKLYRYVDQE